MSIKRRHFLKSAIGSGLLLGTGLYPSVLKAATDRVDQLVILHTNDVHSRIDPFPEDGGPNAGRGGAARRKTIIDKVRLENEHVLLLDSGDMFQGTPYFNLFGGEVELKVMTELGYDAATLGNHDFDGGLDGLHKQLRHAKFPLINANYDLSDTIMVEKTQPYQIFEKGNLKIGVFGLGIELIGLVGPELYGNTQYLNPLPIAQKMANQLKLVLECDYVICLSHLGYKYAHQQVSDVVLAAETENIDLILGGHTHTFLTTPTVIENRAGKEVLVNQVGWGGLVLGRLDIYFEKGLPGHCQYCENSLIKP